jgi:predicted SAM-dependent methyltransferase
LKNKTPFFSKRLKVLDIGPERSFSKFCRSLSNIQYVSTDLFSKTAMTKMDLTKLAFRRESFDYIICFHVLEHIKDDLSAMHELFHVLKSEGRALIQVPIDVNRAETFEASNVSEKDYEAVYGQFDHVRIYGLDFGRKLEKAGFNVTIEPYFDELDEKTIRRYALKRSYRIKLYETNDDIYNCSR